MTKIKKNDNNCSEIYGKLEPLCTFCGTLYPTAEIPTHPCSVLLN